MAGKFRIQTQGGSCSGTIQLYRRKFCYRASWMLKFQRRLGRSPQKTYLLNHRNYLSLKKTLSCHGCRLGRITGGSINQFFCSPLDLLGLVDLWSVLEGPLLLNSYVMPISYTTNLFKPPSPLGARVHKEVRESHDVSELSLIQIPDVPTCFGIIIPLVQIIHSVFYWAHNTSQKNQDVGTGIMKIQLC